MKFNVQGQSAKVHQALALVGFEVGTYWAIQGLIYKLRPLGRLNQDIPSHSSCES